jgi:hypothetical protein
MDLFTEIASKEKQHAIFKLICGEDYAAERAVLRDWATDFLDRDGKFVYEFQTTFEPCLWELYLFACLKEINASVDFSSQVPDFLVEKDHKFCIEATISAPASGTPPPHSFDITTSLPDDFNEFNRQATLRICNSFTSKEKKYISSYRNLEHVKDKPFIIAIASFDRPFSHMAASRPIMSALYGIYHDEEETIARNASNVIQYDVNEVNKNKDTNIPLGYFADNSYSHISAVIYSSLATWGKIRALADNPNANSVYVTFHPNENDIKPIVKSTLKKDYKEHLIDGLYIFHNPFADNPIPLTTFDHPRIAQFYSKDKRSIEEVAPDDFLLLRYLGTINRHK